MKTFDNPDVIITDVLDSHGKWRAKKPALICGDRRVTWAAFNRRINRVANGFKKRGLKKKWIPSRVNVLVLKLADVMREVRRFEDGKLKGHITDKSRKTILDGADPEATMLESYLSNFAGGHLYRLAEYHLFPLRVDSVYRIDDTGFYQLLVCKGYTN